MATDILLGDDVVDLYLVRLTLRTTMEQAAAMDSLIRNEMAHLALTENLSITMNVLDSDPNIVTIRVRVRDVEGVGPAKAAFTFFTLLTRAMGRFDDSDISMEIVVEE